MNNKIIFNTCPDSEFFGRDAAIEEIYQHATSLSNPANSIYLVGKRWIGKTEMLKRIYNRLFWEQNRVAPIYYRFKCGYNIEDIANDYIRDFVKQYIAFLTKKPELVTENIPINKLERILSDMEDLAPLFKSLSLHRESKKYGDHLGSLRDAVQMPHQAAVHGNMPIFLMLDDFDLVGRNHLYKESPNIAKEFIKAMMPGSMMSGSISYLITGHIKKLPIGGISPNSIKIMELGGLNEESSIRLAEEISARYHIHYDSEILSVAARQLEGNPVYLRSIIAAAQKENRNLTTLKDFIDIYIAELSGGSICFSLGSIISIKSLNALRILHTCIHSKNGVSEEELLEKLVLDHDGAHKLITNLCDLYLLEKGYGLLKWIGGKVEEDYIHYLYETEVKQKTGAEAKTKIAREKLKHGFYLQGVKIKEKIKDDVLLLLKIFNGQAVPRVLFRNQDFLAQYNKNAYLTIGDLKEGDKILLPQMVGHFNDVAYRETAGAIIIGHGFNNGRYDDENEVAWIIGVKETSPPVNKDDVENFIKQCNIVASDMKAATIRRWMVSKEGFTGEALKMLDIEGIYTSDAVQLRIVRDIIEGSYAAHQRSNRRSLAPLKEFEIILPMSTRAELVAAKAVEEIGTDIGIDNNTITQIKTALVEACINAFEHSKIKNGKVYCKFIVSDDRIVLNIQNEGKDFTPLFQSAPKNEDNLTGLIKRGWGIELMKQLMDEVRFEKIQGGTKLVMVKYIKRNSEAAHEQEL